MFGHGLTQCAAAFRSLALISCWTTRKSRGLLRCACEHSCSHNWLGLTCLLACSLAPPFMKAFLQVNTNPSLLCGTAVDWIIKEPLARATLGWAQQRMAVRNSSHHDEPKTPYPLTAVLCSPCYGTCWPTLTLRKYQLEQPVRDRPVRHALGGNPRRGIQHPTPWDGDGRVLLWRPSLQSRLSRALPLSSRT